jgi:hypothetical protein
VLVEDVRRSGGGPSPLGARVARHEEEGRVGSAPSDERQHVDAVGPVSEIEIAPEDIRGGEPERGERRRRVVLSKSRRATVLARCGEVGVGRSGAPA